MNPYGKSRAKELHKLLKHVVESAVEVVKNGEASKSTREKILEDLRTAEYVFKRSLDKVETWAKRD